MSQSGFDKIPGEMADDLQEIQLSVNHFNSRQQTYISYISKELNVIGKMTGYKPKNNDVMPQPPLLELKIHHAVSIHYYHTLFHISKQLNIF